MIGPSYPAQRASARDLIADDVAERTGIDEAMIERLVRTFYGRVQKDDLLGPVFAGRITDWEPHIKLLCSFWSSVVLMTGRYHGQPMAKHLPLSIGPEHFDRRLALFGETAREICPPAAAEHFIARAQRIGASLEMGRAAARGEIGMRDLRR
jgi:hemoglobin